MNFSEKIKKQLENYGWYPSRNVANTLEIPLDEYDYPNFVLEFLKEYGGLRIKELEENRERLPEEYRSDNLNELILEPSYGEDSNSDEDGLFFYYGKLIQKKLYSLGYFMHDNYFIVCDDQGYVYMLGDYCFFRGYSIQEGIENLLTDNWKGSKEFDENSSSWISISNN